MAAFQKKDATTAKPYLTMIGDKIANGQKVKFFNKPEETIEQTPDIKKLLAAIKTGNETNILRVLYPNNKPAAIFNAKSWTQIDKAPFSGQGGSGAGAEVTALTESLQCFFNSLAFNILKRPLKNTDVNETNLQKAGSFVEADRSLSDCLKKGPADWMEQGVYVKIANKIYSVYRSKLVGRVTFHRGSSFMNGLYAAKAECHKRDKASQSPQAPGSFSNDKWNPGDIWATTFSSSERPLDGSSGSWGDLNKQVADLAGATGGRTKLLGISLKKTITPTITYYRDPQSKSMSQVSYKGYIYGKNGDFFSSQDIYVESSAGVMQCRTFGGDTSWQGEIKGKMAAGGKIGGGNLDFYAKQFLKEDIFGSGSERTLFTEAKKNNERFVKKFYDLYVEGNKNQLRPQPVMTFEEFNENVQSQPQKFINSKYACLMLVQALNASSQGDRNKFMNAIFRYASSDTDQSSFYIKVH